MYLVTSGYNLNENRLVSVPIFSKAPSILFKHNIIKFFASKTSIHVSSYILINIVIFKRSGFAECISLLLNI